MATIQLAPDRPGRADSGFKTWLLEGAVQAHQDAVHVSHQAPWYKVMCLTGLDYFSSLGFQPGIAALAAGLLSPLATVFLVLLTLLGALPVYRRVAVESPHGQGSIAMLERLLPWWQGKALVLALLGFAGTDFIMTITMSASDATEHILENPFAPHWIEGQNVAVTLVLIAVLGAVFVKGFREAIGVAVALVVSYLALTAVVTAVALQHVAASPTVIVNWRDTLVAQYTDVPRMLLISWLVFPRLALGLSGFETGVSVMPLVRGCPTDTSAQPTCRTHNTWKLLTLAALLMSAFLLTSAFTTTLLIPQEEFEEGGRAYGRALAFLAHEYLGDGFGTAYDLSTIFILWFAGGSAMAGLLSIVPRYLPRYGMAPDWARAVRPLVIVFTILAFIVTILFGASVQAQAGAFATGLLVLITSASFAVTLAAKEDGQRLGTVVFAVITLVFVYATLANIAGRPDGLKIALFFIGAIVVFSLISRALRSTELRTTEVEFDERAERFIQEAARQGTIRVIANQPDERNTREYLLKEREEREASHIPRGDPVLFLEVTVKDPSDFATKASVKGEEIGGHKVLLAESASVPHGLAATLLAMQDQAGERPHAYLGWGEDNPLKFLARFLFFGEGDIAPVTHEILRRSDPNPRTRPVIHVG
jgi:hypothetical protein